MFQYDMLDKGLKTDTNVKFNSLVCALYKSLHMESGEQSGLLNTNRLYSVTDMFGYEI